MARVTVEDCIVRVPNRFDLVILASQRARAVSAGAPITVERDNDKNPVIALREIAEESILADDLLESVIRDHQKLAEVDEPEEEEMEMLAVESLTEGALEAEDEAKPGDSGEDGKSDGTAETKG